MVSELLRGNEWWTQRIVLILVLVGYGLWEPSKMPTARLFGVLILVLVGYGLWVGSHAGSTVRLTGLNPCFGGIWSLSPSQSCQRRQRWNVLILVLVGYGLWDETNLLTKKTNLCLNPCFGGIWSLRKMRKYIDKNYHGVLILVLVGYGLWVNFSSRYWPNRK